jgi:hypothetical protein
MFTPGLAIFYLATILRLSHVCDFPGRRTNALRFGALFILPDLSPWCYCASVIPISMHRFSMYITVNYYFNI